MDPPSGVAEVGRPTEVVEHDPQIGQLAGEPRHRAHLVARGLDGGHEVVAGHQAEVLHHHGLVEQCGFGSRPAR